LYHYFNLSFRVFTQGLRGPPPRVGGRQMGIWEGEELKNSLIEALFLGILFLKCALWCIADRTMPIFGKFFKFRLLKLFFVLVTAYRTRINHNNLLIYVVFGSSFFLCISDKCRKNPHAYQLFHNHIFRFPVNQGRNRKKHQ
jgi:hypothetical protein